MNWLLGAFRIEVRTGRAVLVKLMVPSANVARVKVERMGHI